MNISVDWEKVIELGPKANFVSRIQKTLIEDVSNAVPEEPGIYVFARRFHRTITPIYIGQALDLRDRVIKQFNNLKLMTGVQNGLSGERLLLIARVTPATESKVRKALRVAELAHIEHAMTAGHELLNVHGTRTKHDVIEIDGTKSQTHPFPRIMYRPSK